MYLRFLIVLILSVSSAIGGGRAPDVKCVFLARRIVTMSDGIKTADRPFENCRIYVFTVNGDGKYVESAGSPLMTDKEGAVSGFFDPKQVYSLYFAGRELSVTEREEIKQHDGRMLLKFQASTKQPAGSAFEVAQDGQSLKATVGFSLPLWIAYLQRFEVELANPAPQVTLSKARQLFYEPAQPRLLVGRWGGWSDLIATDVDPIFDWDRKAGTIKMNDSKVSLDTCEALSNKYDRNGLQYNLKGNERVKLVS